MNNRFSVQNKSNVSNEKIVLIKDLNVSFKENKVLKNLNLYLKKGETLAIVGENGAGKSVLIETILNLYKKDSGKIYLNLGGKNFSENLKKIGIQFQNFNFSKGDKVKKIINFYNKLYKEISKEKLEEMIIVFGIKEYLNKKINKISGGQRQRLNLLLSLLPKPKLMILDEFITGLDVKSVKKIISFVNEFKIENDASMIIISHQPEEIKELSNRIVVLKDGSINGNFETKEILNSYNSFEEFLDKYI